MDFGKTKYGIVVGTVLFGALLGHYCAPMTRSGLRSGRYIPAAPQIAQAVDTINFAVLGAFVGVCVDVAINGWRRRKPWRFSLRLLLLAVAAFAILLYGIQSWWQFSRS